MHSTAHYQNKHGGAGREGGRKGEREGETGSINSKKQKPIGKGCLTHQFINYKKDKTLLET